MNSTETNLTAEVEQVSKAKVNPEIKPNPCQGYKVNPITKLHLCTACEYHHYRNETKP